ncbi:MAG: hypothetical protein WCH74_01480 [Chloroflexota bacterium]
MLGASRIIIVFFSALLIVGGVLLAIGLPGDGGVIAGFVLVVMGAGGIGAVVFERMRYRSDAEERTTEPASRAGGDPAGTPLPTTFRPTDERFVDPATGVRMRVWYEPRTGERRYLPDDSSGGATW